MVKRKHSTLPTTNEDRNMLDQFSPMKVGKIIPTAHKPRVNVFESYIPRKEQCLDYKISQTFANFQKGDLKVNVKETRATYEPLPPEVCKKIKKKVTRFHGGPPQWEFIDEIWLRQQEVGQKKAIQELRQATTEKNKTRRRRKIREHEIVQRLVGPEWFMELSPNQLNGIDRLHYAINKDLNDSTVVNTQEIMATLGLVLRPNQRHLEIALKHSCGSSVEFLLVLYQILDPSRETYSLNDRLILSAVVHLAIIGTLQELHVRIPSPPNEPQPKIEKKFKKEKKRSYKSPYLQPQTFYPQPPKFSGIYENTHIQWPESRYFAYLPILELERKQFKTMVRDLRKNLTPEDKERWKEYDAVQNFYDILPGAMDTLMLLPASKQKICWNLLNKRIAHQPPTIHLVEVSETDDEECCNCLQLKEKKLADTLAKRSTCDKGATKFIEQNLPCDECLQRQLLKSCVKVMGGFVSMTCPCDYVPVIQGTCLTKPCECFTDYRNRIVIARARQLLTDSGTKHVISGITITKFGAVYNFAATLGETDCKCQEIQQIKKWKRKERSKLLKNKTKFSICGIQMTKNGPIYILSNAVARKACGCIDKYRNSLIMAETQHQIKRNPAKFVTNGIINTKQFGPVFCFAGAFDHKMETNRSLKDFCGCLVKKPKCLEKCENRAEYLDVFNKENRKDSRCKKEYSKVGGVNQSTQDNEAKNNEIQTDDPEDESISSCTCTSSSEISSNQSASSFYCESCVKKQQESIKRKKYLCEICQERENNRDKYCGIIKSDESSTSTVSNPCKCRCKEALGKFMDAKCQCEDCMVKIRQGYATHIFGGTKVTSSGNTLNLVQGIHQPQCSCVYDHLNKIKQVEEYKSRAILRYKAMRRIDKYCISGVTMTKDGPVYNISGITPPVECDCAIQIRQRQEEEERRQRMPKIPNTGRVKFSVVGVKQLSSKENVYILANALQTEECDCMTMLRKFEEAHMSCVDEFDRFLGRIKEEEEAVDSPGPHGDATSDHQKNDLGFLTNDPEMFEPIRELEGDNTDNKLNSNVSAKLCTCNKNEISEGDTTEESSSEYDSKSESEFDSESEEFGPCTILKSDQIKPIVLKERVIPEYFMSKRYVIFKRIPKNKEEQEMILKHILEGMAEDGFSLAKLPQAYKLPIFTLWWEMRSGIYWTQADRHKYVNKSIEFWKHTDFCYKEPDIDQLPFTKSDVRKLTWANAEMIRAVTTQYTYNYYRKVKQVTIATGREFFAPTFDYQFPTATWRDCAFAYLPTKEEAVFPYKIYQPHEARNIPKNKKVRCNC